MLPKGETQGKADDAASAESDEDATDSKEAAAPAVSPTSEKSKQSKDKGGFSVESLIPINAFKGVDQALKGAEKGVDQALKGAEKGVDQAFKGVDKKEAPKVLLYGAGGLVAVGMTWLALTVSLLLNLQWMPLSVALVSELQHVSPYPAVTTQAGICVVFKIGPSEWLSCKVHAFEMSCACTCFRN